MYNNTLPNYEQALGNTRDYVVQHYAKLGWCLLKTTGSALLPLTWEQATAFWTTEANRRHLVNGSPFSLENTQ